MTKALTASRVVVISSASLEYRPHYAAREKRPSLHRRSTPSAVTTCVQIDICDPSTCAQQREGQDRQVLLEAITRLSELSCP